jgi:hypothetical protein
MWNRRCSCRGSEVGDHSSTFDKYRRVRMVKGNDERVLLATRNLILYLRKPSRAIFLQWFERGIKGMVILREEFGLRIVMVWASFR